MSNKSTLVTFFETGDIPSAVQFADLINSQVNLFETSDQSMAGALVTTQLVTPQVSATNVNVTGTLTALTATFTVNTLTATTVSAASGHFSSDVNVSGNVSVVGAVSAQSTNTVGAAIRSVSVVSAAGSTQATGAVLGANGIIRLKGITDGTATGFVLLANLTGNQQTFYVEENTSCNLYPCPGGQINALGSNAAFSLAGNTQYIVTHIKASGYAVK